MQDISFAVKEIKKKSVKNVATNLVIGFITVLIIIRVKFRNCPKI